MKIKKSLLSIFTLGVVVVAGNATELQRDGWNLVSVCQNINRVDIDMTEIEEIQNQDGLSIYTGKFEENSNLETLEAGYGYWVKGSAGTTFDGGTATIGVEKPLNRDGWSLMAMCENMNATDIDMASIAEIQSQGGLTLYAGDWLDYSNLEQLDNGYAYWVDGVKDTPWRAKQGPMVVAVLADSTATVLENSIAGVIGQITISSMGDSAITAITLSGTGHENFVVSNGGAISVSNTANIDYEARTSYSLSVVATNGAGASNTANLQVTVSNEIDLVPSLTTPAQSSVDENVTVGTEVVSMSTNGTTADENSVDRYNIVGGNDSNAFEISDAGVITVANALDYETLTTYTLEVEASNVAGSSTTVNVAIKVNDILDIPFGTPSPMINNANQNVETTQGNYTIRLYSDYVQSVNAQSNHIGVVVNLNGTNSNLMSVQSDYAGHNLVAAVYDENGVLVGVSDVTVVEGRVVNPVVSFGGKSGDTITHNGVSYGKVISPDTGRVWLDRNLGASRVCESFNDEQCYGDYYQWGRNADGHEKSDSLTTSSLATTIIAGHSKFITTNNTDWTTEDSTGSLRASEWAKLDGTSVCPIGFRVPTKSELGIETVDASIPVNNNIDAFSNFLKVPAAGQRSFTDGHISSSGYGGLQSISYNNNATIDQFVFSNSGSNIYGNNSMSFGFPVRCIAEEQDTTPPTKPVLVDTVPTTINGESFVRMNINGESGSSVFIDGVLNGTVDETGNTSIELSLLRFIGGDSILSITLKDASENESEALEINILQETDLGSNIDLGIDLP